MRIEFSMIKETETKTALPVRTFASEAAFEKWLQANHARSSGLWLKFFKKVANKKALMRKGALDAALCYGWIGCTHRTDKKLSPSQKFILGRR